MVIVIGTSSGFVETAPSADPTGTDQVRDNTSWVTHDTSPATATTITEIGWYCDNATEAANFEVGLYAADGTVVPGEAGTLLEVSRTNAKGTSSGWKAVTGLNWSISSSTAYWLGVQLDDTATSTNANYTNSGGSGMDGQSSQSTLSNPYGGGGILAGWVHGTYAVWEAGVEVTNTQINIGDDWKTIDAMQINIGDSWRAVAGAQVNIGDSWRTIF